MTTRFRSAAMAAIITDLAVVEVAVVGLVEDGLVLHRLDPRVDEKSGPRPHDADFRTDLEEYR